MLNFDPVEGVFDAGIAGVLVRGAAAGYGEPREMEAEQSGNQPTDVDPASETGSVLALRIRKRRIRPRGRRTPYAARIVDRRIDSPRVGRLNPDRGLSVLCFGRDGLLRRGSQPAVTTCLGA